MARVQEFLDRQLATRPQATALIEPDGSCWSYARLGRAVDALAVSLAEAGAVAGDRVLILSENCAEMVAALCAVWRTGGWAVPVNARLSAPELDRILDHAAPALLLATVRASPDAAAHAGRLGATALPGELAGLALARPAPSAPDADRDIAALLYTTGTTGAPKGVMLSHDNLCFGGRSSAALRGMRANDLVYGALPMTHIFGLASMLVAALHAGAAIRLETRFSAAALYAALGQGVTLLPAVPQMHAALMAHVQAQGLGRLPPGRLRYVSSGGAPLDPDWKARAEAFYGLPLQNGYGLTETTAGVCATSHRRAKPDVSVGHPLPGVELAIDDTVPGGGDGLGEVLIRGANVMRGYYRNPDATAAVLDARGWFRSGDLGRIDDQGRLHIQGRSKELIIHGGFNVYPPEVEAALNAHPDVVQAAVVGRTVPGDEQVLAFVQVQPGSALTVAALREFVAARLVGYKRPAHIVLSESLPAAATGKILRHRLLAHFADRLPAL